MSLDQISGWSSLAGQGSLWGAGKACEGHSTGAL